MGSPCTAGTALNTAPTAAGSLMAPPHLSAQPQTQWQVPLELIEWQPVYHQHGATGVEGGSWSGNWEVTKSTKARRGGQKGGGASERESYPQALVTHAHVC